MIENFTGRFYPKKDYETAEGYILYLQEKKPDFRRDEVNALAESISASAL